MGRPRRPLRRPGPLALGLLLLGLPAAAAAGGGGGEGIASALEEALRPGAPRPELRVLVECRRQDGFASAEVFGDGLGIWNGTAQFRLPREGVRAILELLREARFAAMPPSFGGREDPRTPGPGTALRMTCRVAVRLGGARKEVVQFDEGRQSPELRDLARGILDLCAAPAREGVGAADLADGLAKLARGILSPRTFELLAHRRPEAGGDEGEGEGWLLRIAAGRATLRPYSPGAGYGEAATLELAAAEVGALAAFLLELGVETLPPNLYAPVYTDVEVRVLDRSRQIQARRFSGLTPETHGGRQAAFDGLIRRLEELAGRIRREGA